MKRVDKPWGHELIWAHTDRYVGKVLHIKAGEALSLQYHRHKDETVMVLRGRMRFEYFRDGESSQAAFHRRDRGSGSGECGKAEAGKGFMIYD